MSDSDTDTNTGTDGDGDLERVAMIQYLDPDRVDDYLEAHEEVPEPVVEHMRACGVETFELFVEGDLSVGYVELEDFEQFVEDYSANPDAQAWEERVGEFKRSGVDTDEAEIPLMDHVWSLDDATE
jgi:L-rhamnose mutarotase